MRASNRLLDRSFAVSVLSALFRMALQTVLLLWFLPGFAEDRTGAANGVSPLAPWVGTWTIVEDQPSLGAMGANQAAVVEIRLTSDGIGLDISRKSPNQPDVKEVLIPDGNKRPVEEQNCSGWRSAHLVAEAGLIVESSEMNCKDAGSIATSSLRIILAADRIAHILALKAGGQTRLAVRRLSFEYDLPSAPDSQTGWRAVAARTELSAPWNLETIIRLSKIIDGQLLQAALLEKKTQLNLTPGSLKEMKTARLPNGIIDLLVALAYPDQFHIEKNGQVELRPWIVSSPGSAGPSSMPSGPLSYYPGAFYNCYSPYGYFYGFPFSGLYSAAFCISYYSPFWWDYPIYIPDNGGGGSGGSVGGGGGGRLTSDQGYVQIEPRDTGRHARPREGFVPSSGIYRSGTSSQSYPTNYGSGTAASSSGSNAGGSSAGGGAAAAPSASPGGYSSGSSGGGTAVPRQ